MSHSITRTQFLNKFYLYCGFARTAEYRKEYECGKQDIHEILKCDKQWPVCLFDFTYKNKVPDYFVYRVEKSSYHIRENYFYSEFSENGSVSSKGKVSNHNNLIDTLNEENEEDASSPWSKRVIKPT
jgi:hypothetical protein